MAVALALIYARPPRSARAPPPPVLLAFGPGEQEGWPFLGGVPGSDPSATRCLRPDTLLPLPSLA